MGVAGGESSWKYLGRLEVSGGSGWRYGGIRVAGGESSWKYLGR